MRASRKKQPPRGVRTKVKAKTKKGSHSTAGRSRKAVGNKTKKKAKKAVTRVAKASAAKAKRPAAKKATAPKVQRDKKLSPSEAKLAVTESAAIVPVSSPDAGAVSDSSSGGSSSAEDKGNPPPLPTPIATFNF